MALQPIARINTACEIHTFGYRYLNGKNNLEDLEVDARMILIKN
jgi:hypothetical protein